MAGQPDVKMNGQQRKTRLPNRSGFGLYCLLTGVSATAVGAAVSLLAAGFAARVVVWAGVLLTATAAAAWWWAADSATARRWTVDLLVRPAAKNAPHRKSW